MPFRDELQAAHDKIAALEQRLRERQEPEANVDQLELLAILRRERQLAESALAAEKAARQADKQTAQKEIQEEIARARTEEAVQRQLIVLKEEQDKLLSNAFDARNKEIEARNITRQENLTAKAKHLQDALESTRKNIEQIQQQANIDLEALASQSRERALRSYQSQLSDLQLQIKQNEVRLSLPPPPSLTNEPEAQMEREVQQAMRKVDEDILSAMRKREAHLARMCAILHQPPKE